MENFARKTTGVKENMLQKVNKATLTELDFLGTNKNVYVLLNNKLVKITNYIDNINSNGSVIVTPKDDNNAVSLSVYTGYVDDITSDDETVIISQYFKDGMKVVDLSVPKDTEYYLGTLLYKSSDSKVTAILSFRYDQKSLNAITYDDIRAVLSENKDKFIQVSGNIIEKLDDGTFSSYTATSIVNGLGTTYIVGISNDLSEKHFELDNGTVSLETTPNSNREMNIG